MSLRSLFWWCTLRDVRGHVWTLRYRVLTTAPAAAVCIVALNPKTAVPFEPVVLEAYLLAWVRRLAGRELGMLVRWQFERTVVGTVFQGVAGSAPGFLVLDLTCKALCQYTWVQAGPFFQAHFSSLIAGGNSDHVATIHEGHLKH